MLVNALMYNDEIDLLKFRCEYYFGIVDKIYLIESDMTFSGKRKDLHFSNLTTEEKDSLKIPVIPIILDRQHLNHNDFHSRWNVEEETRKQLLTYIFKHDINCHVFLSDADEFASIEQLEFVKNKISVGEDIVGSILMRTSYRRANWNLLGPGKKLLASSVFPANIATNTYIYNKGGRYLNAPLVCGEAGSHLSYLKMDSFGVSAKLSAFSHSEYDTDIMHNEIVVKIADRYVVDHLPRARNLYFGLLWVRNSKKLNSVERSALEHRSDWFDFTKPKDSLIARIAASIGITNSKECGEINELANLLSPKGNSIGIQISTIIIFMLSRLRNLLVRKVLKR